VFPCPPIQVHQQYWSTVDACKPTQTNINQIKLIFHCLKPPIHHSIFQQSIQSFINILIPSILFTSTFIHSFVGLFTHSFIGYSSTHPFINSLTQSSIHSSIPSFPHLFHTSFIHSLTYSFIHTFIHPLFIHTFIQTFFCLSVHHLHTVISGHLEKCEGALPHFWANITPNHTIFNYQNCINKNFLAKLCYFALLGQNCTSLKQNHTFFQFFPHFSRCPVYPIMYLHSLIRITIGT